MTFPAFNSSTAMLFSSIAKRFIMTTREILSLGCIRLLPMVIGSDVLCGVVAGTRQASIYSLVRLACCFAICFTFDSRTRKIPKRILAAVHDRNVRKRVSLCLSGGISSGCGSVCNQYNEACRSNPTNEPYSITFSGMSLLAPQSH